MTGYLRLTLMYSRALLLIAAAFSVALSGDFLISLNLVPYPGIVMSGMDAQFKTLRMVAVVNDRYQGVLAASEGVSVRPALRPTFSFWDEARPWASAYHVMTSDMNSIESSQRNILYGNESLGIPLKPLNNAYNRYFFEPKATGDKRSLFERVSMFVDSAIRIALTDLGNAGLVLTDVRSVFGSAPSIAEEYRMFIDAYQSDIERQISQLYDLSIGMFVLVVCAILGTYFFYWRPILSYLINTENERTLKLLLMIPVEIVADIDSLRELLHLRQSTRIVNPVQQNQGPIFP
ncbi:hypothetical protein BC829DRAFT_202565 [Chytridium lagenaria]|nr:hypothetical protein BC829DRAFT_202565 [Chytridium lagenaria]